MEFGTICFGKESFFNSVISVLRESISPFISAIIVNNVVLSLFWAVSVSVTLALNLLNDSVTSCRDDLIPSISTSLCFCVGIASSLAVASSIVSSSFITAKPNALFNALTKFFANFMFTFF